MLKFLKNSKNYPFTLRNQKENVTLHLDSTIKIAFNNNLNQ